MIPCQKESTVKPSRTTMTTLNTFAFGEATGHNGALTEFSTLSDDATSFLFDMDEDWDNADTNNISSHRSASVLPASLKTAPDTETLSIPPRLTIIVPEDFSKPSKNNGLQKKAPLKETLSLFEEERKKVRNQVHSVKGSAYFKGNTKGELLDSIGFYGASWNTSIKLGSGLSGNGESETEKAKRLFRGFPELPEGFRYVYSDTDSVAIVQDSQYR